MASARIIVEPKSALVDPAVSIRLDGFPSREHVSLRARARDDLGRMWESLATYVTDENGVVDLSPVSVFLTAEVKDKIVKNETMERRFLATGIRTESLSEDGLRGTLFLPSIKPSLGVIVLGGDPGGGGKGPVQRAALLSSHGYAALTLPYFGDNGLPETPMNIPLEYFQKAVTWLLKNPAVEKEGVVAIGDSRGAELALLLGTMLPQISAVVAHAPASILRPGRDKNGAGLPPTWTYEGRPLPYLREIPTPEEQSAIGRGELSSVRPTVLNAIKESTIPVERIRGPILLISGLDDKMSPSALMAEMIMKRLESFNHPFSRRHLTYTGAGHNISVPYLPPEVGKISIPSLKEPVDFGGSVEATAHASLDSSNHVLDFLRTHSHARTSDILATSSA